jgi:tRNA (guanine37-N1)-methyltransferase
VLLEGDHARVAEWRREQAMLRTAARRPDLLHPSRTLRVSGEELVVRLATPADAGELLTLQLACWVEEARANDSLDIPALTEDLADVRGWLAEWTTFVVHAGSRLVGAVRCRLDGEVWDIGRLMVAPDLRGRGLGRWLLEHAERTAVPGATRVSLFTGAHSAANLRMYRRAGYRRDREQPDDPAVVRLGKPLRR